MSDPSRFGIGRPGAGPPPPAEQGTLAGVVRTVYSFIGITTIPISLYRCGDGGDRFGGTCARRTRGGCHRRSSCRFHSGHIGGEFGRNEFGSVWGEPSWYIQAAPALVRHGGAGTLGLLLLLRGESSRRVAVADARCRGEDAGGTAELGGRVLRGRAEVVDEPQPLTPTRLTIPGQGSST